MSILGIAHAAGVQRLTAWNPFDPNVDPNQSGHRAASVDDFELQGLGTDSVSDTSGYLPATVDGVRVNF
jgi:hypothetical protein